MSGLFNPSAIQPFPPNGGAGGESLTADYVSHDLSIVDLDDIPVEQVITMEETQKNFAFVGHDALYAEVYDLFSGNRFLEAVLITESVKVSQKPIGIMTRWNFG